MCGSMISLILNAVLTFVDVAFFVGIHDYCCKKKEATELKTEGSYCSYVEINMIIGDIIYS